MNCEACGLEMAFIRGGISKKTGKKFESFYSCQCGNTYNPPKETLQVKPTVSRPTVSSPQVATNSELMMRLAYRKDLMVAIINQGLLDQAEEIFDKLWGKVEQ